MSLNLLLTLFLLLGMSSVFYYRPAWSLPTVVFLLPFERLGSYALFGAHNYATIRLVQIAGAALIIASVGRWAWQKELITRVRHFPLPLAAFAVSTLVSAGLIGGGRVWQNYLWGLFVIVLFWTVAELASESTLSRLAKTLLASAALVSLFGLFQYFGDLAGLPVTFTQIGAGYSKTVLGYPRIRSVAIEPLNFANYLLMPLLVGLSLAIWNGFKNKYVNAALTIIGLAFLLTTSRGALIAAIPGLVILGYCHREALRRHAKALAVSVCLLVIVAALGLGVGSRVATESWTHGPQLFTRMLTTGFTNNASYQERSEANRLTQEACAGSGLFGFGLGKIGASTLPSSPRRTAYDQINPMNFWMELPCETGTVGTLSFIGFLILLFITVRRALVVASPEVKAWLAGLLAATTAIMIQAQSFSGFYITYIWVALGLLWGLTRVKSLK